MKIKYKFCFLMSSVLTILSISFQKGIAQINPQISMFYQNEYLANPAMAGVQKGFNINAAYKHDLVSEKGMRSNNALTLDYQFKKAGLGLNINMDKDGLLNTNRYLATYAYHLPFVNNSQLHFGLSAGVSTEKFNMSDIIGDTDDALIMQYNDLKPEFDADFGIAYTSDKYNIQAVLPNLRDLIYDQSVSRIYTPTTFYTAVSYKLTGEFGRLEPKVVYRGVKNYNNIVDAGVNFSTSSENFNALLMYHSSNNATAGVGFTYQKNYQVQLAYVTPVNSSLQQYTYGSVQIGLKLRFLDK